jgi:uncharacterized protein YerC
MDSHSSDQTQSDAQLKSAQSSGESQDHPLLKALCSVAQQRGARQQYAWFVAALTPKEALNLERRLEVARLLQAGASYTDIQKLLHVSAATVAQVSQQLQESSEFADLIKFVGREQNRWRRFLSRS